MITIYGLKNCDTCRKIQKELKAEGISFEFKDVRADGLAKEDLQKWAEAAGLDVLLNKRGTTWRKLDDSQKENLSDEDIIDLILKMPALMKRPVTLLKGEIVVGYAKKEQDQIKSLL